MSVKCVKVKEKGDLKGSIKSSDYYVTRAREPYPEPYSYGTGQ